MLAIYPCHACANGGRVSIRDWEETGMGDRNSGELSRYQRVRCWCVLLVWVLVGCTSNAPRQDSVFMYRPLDDMYTTYDMLKALENVSEAGSLVLSVEQPLSRHLSDLMESLTAETSHSKLEIIDGALSELEYRDQADQVVRQDLASTLLIYSLYLQEYDRHEEALTKLNRAITVQPNNWRLYFHRGMLHRWLGDQAKADADFEQGRKIFPEAFVRQYSHNFGVI